MDYSKDYNDMSAAELDEEQVQHQTPRGMHACLRAIGVHCPWSHPELVETGQLKTEVENK